jgi:NAD(P)-dependent dehydrogenase (short-subunit alcohol dehydrogenase family)
VINTSSALGEVAIARQSAYVASKHGVIGLTKAAALEYSARGARVKAILPGLIQTPMVDAIEREQPGFIEVLTAATPSVASGVRRISLIRWCGSPRMPPRS